MECTRARLSLAGGSAGEGGLSVALYRDVRRVVRCGDEPRSQRPGGVDRPIRVADEAAGFGDHERPGDMVPGVGSAVEDVVSVPRDELRVVHPTAHPGQSHPREVAKLLVAQRPDGRHPTGLAVSGHRADVLAYAVAPRAGAAFGDPGHLVLGLPDPGAHGLPTDGLGHHDRMVW